MSMKGFAAGVVVGALAFGSVAALARQIQIAHGVIGVTKGYGGATAVCVTDSGKLANGSRIETITMPIGDQSGNIATGVTFRCQW
ncbi:MAG TPA: hypothetical protein VD995_12090 [Azospirillum sp.]|nr:hypothetical protein [Azospirillum sp.]